MFSCGIQSQTWIRVELSVVPEATCSCDVRTVGSWLDNQINPAAGTAASMREPCRPVLRILAGAKSATRNSASSTISTVAAVKSRGRSLVQLYRLAIDFGATRRECRSVNFLD